MLHDIHFGNADRVNMAGDLTVEQLILAPRAIFNAKMIQIMKLEFYFMDITELQLIS